MLDMLIGGKLTLLSIQIWSARSRLQSESNNTSIGAILGKLCDGEDIEFAKKPAREGKRAFVRTSCVKFNDFPEIFESWRVCSWEGRAFGRLEVVFSSERSSVHVVYILGFFLIFRLIFARVVQPRFARQMSHLQSYSWSVDWSRCTSIVHDMIFDSC
jgi:hypothetical protein